MEKADVILEQKNEELKKALDPITNPKTQKATFQKKIGVYARPFINILIGFIMQIAKGMIGPTFGALMQCCLFSMLDPYLSRA